MQKQLFYLQAWPFVLIDCSEGIWKEARLEDRQQHFLHCLYCEEASDQRITTKESVVHFQILNIYP